jgi:hypothetical protein
MMIKYKAKAGEHISMTAEKAIALAAKHGCKVRMQFNGITLTVNKRLSVNHVVGTWVRMDDAKILRILNKS